MASSEKDEVDKNPSDKEKTHKRPNPEGEDDGMIIKPHCECSKCNYWTKSADWCPELSFESSDRKILKRTHFQPLMKSPKHPGRIPKMFSYNPQNLTKIEKQSVFRTLVHGEIIPEPVKMFNETYFTRDIQKSLMTLNYKYSLPIQSFVWPAIFRQMNVFAIGEPKSGKTLSYLPAVCTFSTIVEDRYEQLAKHKGPLVVIVCSNSKQCEEVYDLIKKLYTDITVKPKITITTYPVNNIHYMDILITIPESLVDGLKARTFNFKRLCHLVFEDTSTLLANNKDTIYKILEVVDEMLEHRVNTAKVQLIVTSEKWTTDLKNLQKSLYVTPLVCIGNYLEAALYGNINFEVKFLMSEQKIAHLEGVLRDKYQLYKTIVICDQDEITEVNKELVRRGINTITVAENCSKEEIEAYELEWTYTPGGQNKVLICTDFVFDSLLCINDAMWLVHYSFPSTWTRFTRRFSALSAHYKSPLESAEAEFQCKSFLLIDETCEKQMPKILNLLNRLTKDLPSHYQQYADSFRTKNELEKIEHRVEICQSLKLFGKCSNSLCDERHLLREESDTTDDLPKSGKVLFKILTIKDVTHYSVQLIEHISIDGSTKEINNDDLKKPLIYPENFEKKRPGEIVKGKFYSHCDYTPEGETHTLCHVLSMKDKNVEVKLSTGLILQTLKTKLFEIPPNLKIVDVYFANLSPPFKDESFSGRSFHVTRTSLENIQYKDMVFTGSVLLQLDNTLWLENIVQMFKVEGNEVIKFNLKKHLLNLNVVEENKTQIVSLHKLCKKCEISVDVTIKRAAKKVVKKDVEPQVAFLQEDVYEVFLSSAVTPDEFYVRLTKFQPLLETLEKEIQTAVQKIPLDKNLQIEIGKFYLALDPKNQIYGRVKILNVEKNQALCFYVDYGDEAVVDISTLKILPSKLITKLPFQAIQCRLYGLSPSFGEWDDEATDILYKYLFEPESDIFRTLFVEMRSKDEGDMVRSKVKYSVLLKDGYDEKHLLLNQLLLDCGFATSIFDKIDDFWIPETKVVNSGSASDSEQFEQTPEDYLEEEMDEEALKNFDFEIHDSAEFLKILGFPDLRQNQLHQDPPRAIESNTPALNEPEQSSETLETSTVLTPEVYWSQTDNSIRLRISLVGVEQYKVNLIQKRIFTFSTKLEDKQYAFKFTLLKSAEIEKHCACGQEVRVILKKMEAVEWLQLTGGKKRLRYIHYEIPENKRKKPRRRFLQLDITDDESDDDDGDKPMYVETSDRDSEFDDEIVSSSEEED